MLNSTIVVRLLIAIAIITLVTLVSQSSQRLAGIISTMPVNITVGLWVVYSVGGSRPQATAPLALAMLWGLIPTMLFTATCWYLLRRGWSLPTGLLVGYAVWAVVAFAPRWLLGSHIFR